MKSLSVALVLAAVSLGAEAQQPAWGQCGGIGWSGATTCVSGYTCTYSNAYYSQCLPGTAPATTSTTKATTTATSTKTSSTTSAPQSTNSACPGAATTKFKYYGVNESGAEFGQGKYPGIKNTDYVWPTTTSYDYFIGKGFNTFRVAFSMERLSPNGLAGSFDATYLSDLKTAINYPTGKGAYAIVNPHNYMRFNGNVITDNAAFKAWWTKVANEFKDNSRVIFDINNEPYGVTATQAHDFNQAGLDGIRAAGATQLVLVSGTAWTGAWSWTTSSGNADVMANINDPSNNWAVQMHQYLDADSSGTNPACVSSTIGVERITQATAWCKAKGVKCFLGEIGAGSNQVCIDAVKGALCHMQQAGGTWIGALWWAAGPWWGDYFQSIEPPNGASISRILPEALMPFM